MTEKRSAFLCKSHPDFHIPADAVVGEGFDGDAYAARLKACGADAVAFFAKCHYGHCYYDTKIGYRHPGLRMDMLAEVVRGCRKYGVGIVGYYSVFLDTAAVRAHPDWRLVSESKATDAGFDSRKFEPVCVSSPYLRELLLPQCSEILDGYDIDEMLFDTMTGFQPCYCPRCRSAFGQAIPTSPADPQWLDYVRWYARQYQEFFATVAEFFHRRRPDVDVTFNWEWSRKRPGRPPAGITHLIGDLLPTGTISSVESHYWAGTGLPFAYMCGRFLHGLGDWNSSTPQSLKCAAAPSIANGGAFWIIDRQLPDGRLEDRAYAAMKDVFGWVKQRREILGGSHVDEIAVLNHWDHIMGPDLRYFADSKQRLLRIQPYEGVARLFMEHARHYTGLNSENLVSRLSRYRVVIVPEQEFLGGEMKAALRKYVEDGGTLLISQSDCAEQMDADMLDLAGVTFERLADHEYGYIDHAVDGMAYPILIHARPAIVRPGADTTTMRRLIPPMSAGGKHFGHGFAPPTSPSGDPAITIRTVGKGRIAFIAAPVFKSYFNYQDPILGRVLLDLIDNLLPDPMVRVQTPAQVGLAVIRKGNDLILHLVNHAGRERLGGSWATVTEYLPEIRGIQVGVKLCDGMGPITEVPSSVAIRPRTAAGYACFEVSLLDAMHSVRVGNYFSK